MRLEHQYLAEEILQEVRSERCQRLDYTKLSALLELVIDNENITTFLRKTPVNELDKIQNTFFELVYQKHIVQGNHDFWLMTKIQSITVAWLMYLYH